MIILNNQTEDNIDINFLESIAKYLKITREIELLIVNNRTIKNINFEYRKIDKPTDVLSFPLEDFEHMPLGSIVISADTAKSIASELGHSFKDEIALLFIHGLLHLLGFDHEIDNGEMREKEKELIKNFNLPNSLIIRGEE